MVQVTAAERSLDWYWTHASSYWSGIADSHPGAVTPGPQWLQAEYHASKLLECIPKDWAKESTVLEYGCGEGRLAMPLASKFREYHGVDLVKSCIDRSVSLKIENARFYMMHEWKPAPGSYDCVVSWTVLMHMPHWVLRQVIEQLTSLLRPGGYLSFQLNLSNLTGEYRYDMVPDHLLWIGRWTPDAIVERELSENGLILLKKQTVWDSAWIARKAT